jgi:glycosyltransferase involved in cell wall biosynthesis
MKILMIAPYAPYPPNSGGRIRMWEQIKYLGPRHQLSVVYFVHSRKEYEQRTVLDDYCHQAVAVVPRLEEPSVNSNLPHSARLPGVLKAYDVPDMYKTLTAINEKTGFDVTIIEHIFMAHYQAVTPNPTILQEQNIESTIFKQLAAIDEPGGSKSDRMEAAKRRTFHKATWMHMVRYENETWPNFPLRITVSDRDKNEMDRRCPSGKSVVIENGVDTTTITPVPLTNARKILFMGTLSYQPNIDAVVYFCQNILPIIWQNAPDTSLVIAGRDPVPAIQALASDSQIEVIANPPDMSVVAQTCCMAIAPLRSGGGTRIKILHAMAMGLPMVSTSIGCEGLTVTDSADIFIRDEPRPFAEAVLRLLTDADMRRQFRSTGRQLVEDRYDWSRKFEQLETELQQLINLS